METCAPSSTSSSHTGATHDGSFALSSFGSNAGFRERLPADLGAAALTPLATFFLAGAFFATAGVFLAPAALAPGRVFFAGRLFALVRVPLDVFFFAPPRVFARLAVELRRFAMERLATPWTVDGTGLGERVIELTAAIARRFEGILAADDAELIVQIVRTKPSANGASLGDALGHPEDMRSGVERWNAGTGERLSGWLLSWWMARNLSGASPSDEP